MNKFVVTVLGISGLVVSLFISNIFQNRIASSLKASLGGDIAIESRKKIPEDIVNKVRSSLPADHKWFYRYQSLTMMGTEEESLLGQAVAVNQDFPIYGKVKLKSNQAQLSRPKSGEVWASPELINRLGLELNQKITVGSSEFLIAGIIDEDLSVGFGVSGFASEKIYMSSDDLIRAGLLQFGATFSEQYVFSCLDASACSNRVKEIIDSAGKSTEIRVVTGESLGQDSQRALKIFDVFLNFVATASLLLGLALNFLFHLRNLTNAAPSLAIEIALGKRRSLLFLQSVRRSAIEGALAGLTSFVLVSLSWKTLALQFSIPEPTFLGQLDVSFGLYALAASTIGSVFSFASAFIVYRNVYFLDASEVFSETPRFLSGIRSMQKGLFILLSFLIGLSVVISKAPTETLLTWTLVGTFGALSLLAWFGICRFLTSATQGAHQNPLFLAVRTWNFESGKMAISIVLSLIFLTLLIFFAFAYQSLSKELEISDNRPNLFLFDIQPSQLEELQKRFSFLRIAPVVRARLMSIRGEPFEFGKNATLDRQVQRGLNLSASEKLPYDQELVTGTWLDGPLKATDGDTLPASLELNYAKRLNLRIGDEFTAELEGKEFKFRITSFRKVKWQNFQPTFFIMVPIESEIIKTGYKTYVATLGNLNDSEIRKTQRELFKVAPNVSVIEVNKAISWAVGIISQIALALFGISLSLFLVSILMIVDFIFQSTQERSRDKELLFQLGLQKNRRERFALFTTFGPFAIVLPLSIGAALALEALLMSQL